MVSSKSDADQFKTALANLAKQDWVRRTERRVWPQFVFHYTDIRNAIKVLNSGCLYSRKYLEDTGQLVVSSGSPMVLAGTDTTIKDCVRLYFRPKTPTQYHTEGVRSKSTLSASMFPDAHCPVPIFFLFNALEILTRSDSWFSNGNLGTNRAKIFSTAAELEGLPWQQIYHTGWIDYSQSGGHSIIFHRHAEVIVPRKMDLNALRYIYCRSEAERETLLHLLPPHLANRYQGKIVATTRSTLFERKHTFIEKARLYSTSADFHFSPETKSPGPFSLQVNFRVASRQRHLKVDDFTLEKSYIFRVKFPISASNYTVQVFLDGHPIYANTYEEANIPF